MGNKQHSLVSVILPVYNGGRELATSIESILSQTYSHFELLISLDGCTDNSEKIICDYKNVSTKISESLISIQDNLYKQALNFRDANTHCASNYNEFQHIVSEKGGFIKCGWDGTSKTENLIKQETKATIRCIINKLDILLN